MTIVGDFTIPAEDFALDHALSTTPEMIVEADRLASHSPKEVFPFLWGTDGDGEAFFDALGDDPTVTDASIADETGEEVLYRLEWSGTVCDLVHELVDHHAAILEARAQADEWTLRLRFANEGMVSSFQEHFHDSGREFTVNQLYHPTEPRQRAFGLTAEQHEALVTAVHQGYFAIPRSASAEELGEMLGVSANAVSERIRRGCEAFIRSGLTTPEDIN